MLQFITDSKTERPISEQVRMAIDGGCRWIELYAPELDEATMRDVAMSIIPVCREADAFVVMRNHTALAAELRLHGMLLDYTENPRKVRNELGGEAIIGVKVDDISQIRDLRLADVDYLVIDASDTAKRDKATADVAMAREEGITMPLVAEGEFTPEDVRALLGAGFSGVAVSRTIAEAENPAAVVKSLIDAQ